MANQWQSLTNKKLHYARLQLDAWDQATELEQGAYREAFLFQCTMAYRSLVAELMDAYKMAPVTLPWLSQAIEQMETGEVDASEIRQLQQMEQEGWLQNLLAEYRKLEEGHLGSTRGAASQMTIDLLMVDAASKTETEGVRSAAAGKELLSQLKDLVLHFRNFNLEW